MSMLHAYLQCLHLALALHTGGGSFVVVVSDRARRLPFFAVLSTGSVKTNREQSDNAESALFH